MVIITIKWLQSQVRNSFSAKRVCTTAHPLEANITTSDRLQALINSLHKVLLLNGVHNASLLLPPVVDSHSDAKDHQRNEDEQEGKPGSFLMMTMRGKGLLVNQL